MLMVRAAAGVAALVRFLGARRRARVVCHFSSGMKQATVQQAPHKLLRSSGMGLCVLSEPSAPHQQRDPAEGRKRLESAIAIMRSGVSGRSEE